MSIPKEPRQLMINLMYLVLTALLALNVSAEVMNAFFTLDQGNNPGHLHQSAEGRRERIEHQDVVQPLGRYAPLQLQLVGSRPDEQPGYKGYSGDSNDRRHEIGCDQVDNSLDGRF